MTPARTIIFCRCRFYALVSDADRQAVEAALSAASGEHSFEIVDDLCELAAKGDPRLAAWAGAGGVTIIACFGRAVRALFAHAGLSLPDDARLLNLRKDGPQAVLQAAEVAPARVAAPAANGASGPGDEADRPQWVPWFPVIDRDRCTNCRKCLGYCLFSVYELAGEAVRVARPANCKTNCPACARVCPSRAIVFPKCKDAPINGDDPAIAPQGDLRADAASLSPADLKEALRRRAARGGDPS